jgi:DNA-binding response OmpR family regulator
MGKYRILVVDDDDDARKLISMMLQTRYEVVEACDGLDALSKLELVEPDFAIIDIMMPIMDGYQVCEAIRRHPRFKTMQVLFLSAHGSRDNIKKGYSVGANLFMTKPIDPERIIKNIDFTIEHEPPVKAPKRYSIEQIAALERVQSQHQDRQEAARESSVRTADRPAKEWHPHEESIFDDEPPSAAAAAPRAASTSVNIPADSGPPRPRLLLVDDDPELVQMLDLALRDDYEVTTAANGIEAIERMVDYQPDIMLIDIMMPKMNGYQLLQSIRRNTYFGTMPVIVLTAECSPRDREYALKLGANQFMGKPFKVEELLATVQAMTETPGFRIRPKRMTIFEIRSRNAADMSKKL